MRGIEPSGPLLTVGIPVFNGRSLLRSCLESVLDSTLPRDRFEVVVVDDGSTEPETFAILQEFADDLAGYPGFFRVITSGTNSGGAARPRNQILDAAAGEYVFFIDSDDTIGDQALERVAEALATTPADWVALHQVPVNGRATVARVRQPNGEVERLRALGTLTVHKVFRRAEIERQQLRFDEGLPSGQDVAFAFAYLLRAERFLMLGGYNYYFLTQHADDPNEPAHLSTLAKSPRALIEKNERTLRSMLAALQSCDLPVVERRRIFGQISLHRVLVQQEHLKTIVRAGPVAGTLALRRLARLLADPLVANLDPADLKGVTAAELARIAKADWLGIALMVGTAGPSPRSSFWLPASLVRRAHRFVVDLVGRVRQIG